MSDPSIAEAQAQANQEQFHHSPQDSLKTGPSNWKGKGKKKGGDVANDVMRSMPVDADAERAVSQLYA